MRWQRYGFYIVETVQRASTYYKDGVSKVIIIIIITIIIIIYLLLLRVLHSKMLTRALQF